MSESSPPPGLQAALDYAARGLDVLPMHTRTERGCSCGNPACDSPGKHPRVRDWGNAATRDPAVIEQRWKTWPEANVGIRTGKLTDGRFLVVLDVDGDEGSDSLAELESEHGELPPSGLNPDLLLRITRLFGSG